MILRVAYVPWMTILFLGIIARYWFQESACCSWSSALLPP